jgi:hypothetical protein
LDLSLRERQLVCFRGARKAAIDRDRGAGCPEAVHQATHEMRIDPAELRKKNLINVDFSPVPSTTNPLGAKGVGEGSTVASTPTVMNAILDALAPLGVTDVPMPATPERIWRAIREHVRGQATT